jgi:hypothetical protein
MARVSNRKEDVTAGLGGSGIVTTIAVLIGQVSFAAALCGDEVSGSVSRPAFSAEEIAGETVVEWVASLATATPNLAKGEWLGQLVRGRIDLRYEALGEKPFMLIGSEIAKSGHRPDPVRGLTVGDEAHGAFTSPETPIYVDGCQYMANIYNENPTGGPNAAGVWLMRDGCGSTTGRVLWNGEPVENAIVALDAEGHKVTAVGTTDAQGRFRLGPYRPGDGAVAGGHRVRIEKLETKSVTTDGINQVSVMPQQYANTATSGLVAIVTVDGKTDLMFAVTGPRVEVRR